ncbi:alpha/beta hydrolase [Deinococcus roseus]|nr:alpha/beta fold hydrolase [Deinococcus roseus]
MFNLVPAQAQQVISFKATDGFPVYATHYPNKTAKAVLLMFHQSGSNKAEYAPIAPEFVKLGFAALATDQRFGGPMFGESNQTIRANPGLYSFQQVMPDLEGAVLWARQKYPEKPIWLMGSSYTSALVFLVAARHPEVKAVLSFSPAEYLDTDHSVRDAAKTLKNTAVFLTGMHTSSEILACQHIYDVLPNSNKTMFIPYKLGIHAASILRPEMKQLGGTEVWSAVRAFVKQHLK